MPAALEPTGVIPLCSMGVEEGVCPAGVSSQRDLRLLAGVGVSEGAPSPPLSVRGVSAHPLPWPGVSVIRRAKHNDVSSQEYVIIINTSTSSVEDQKGFNDVQQCSAEN